VLAIAGVELELRPGRELLLDGDNSAIAVVGADNKPEYTIQKLHLLYMPMLLAIVD
jgi:hypothetical protein